MFVLAAVIIFALGWSVGTLVERRTGVLPPGALDRGVSPGESARLARIENTMDAMNAEIERLSEGQRFLTKLLAERSDERKE